MGECVGLSKRWKDERVSALDIRKKQSACYMERYVGLAWHPPFSGAFSLLLGPDGQALPEAQGVHTQNPDSVPQGLHPAWLHGHVEDSMLVPDCGHLAQLRCLADHDGQLVGNDSVQDGDDHHGEDERCESVDLEETGWTRVSISAVNEHGLGQQPNLVHLPHQGRGSRLRTGSAAVQLLQRVRPRFSPDLQVTRTAPKPAVEPETMSDLFLRHSHSSLCPCISDKLPSHNSPG